MKPTSFLFAGILVLLFHSATGQSVFSPQRLDTLLTRLDERGKAMGSLVLWRNGKPAYQRAIGMSEEGKTVATPTTRYRIGSITKTFTAVLIFQQIEKGKLGLETRLSDFFPELPQAATITIGHLLQHRSGLHSITDDSPYLSWNTQVHSREQLIERMKKGGSDFEPDAKAAYSNSNYILLGWIVEKVTGKSYQRALEEGITRPLSLRDTYVFGKRKKEEAQSFRWTAGGWQRASETDASIPQGAGAIVSTATDVARFFEGLFQGKLVSAQSLATMQKQRDRFGMGLFMMPFYDRQSFGHTGGIDGFISNASYFPKDSTTVVLLTNGMNYPVNDVMLAVLKLYFGKEYRIPTFETKKVDAAKLASYEGVYAAEGFPMKITVRINNGVLEAQASGQGAFPLEPTEEHEFTFDPAGIKLRFDTEKKQMRLKQGSNDTVFTKE